MRTKLFAVVRDGPATPQRLVTTVGGIGAQDFPGWLINNAWYVDRVKGNSQLPSCFAELRQRTATIFACIAEKPVEFAVGKERIRLEPGETAFRPGE